MRRRCKRILLVLAAFDPDDELKVLRNTIEIAVKSEIGSFYDPIDPRRDISQLLDSFRRDSKCCYLHLGLHYGQDLKGQDLKGHLFIVKNRLPEGSDMATKPARPLLTVEEVRGDDEGSATPVSGRRAVDLGGLGCCDCCHKIGCNCGRKFPHLPSISGYLWLTPELFANLCRLGYSLAGPAIQHMTKHDLSEPWEAHVINNSELPPRVCRMT